MVVSNYYLKTYLRNPIQSWFVHLLGECSELILFWATLAKFWPSCGHKMTEDSDLRPLSEKVPLCRIMITGSSSNMVFTLVWGVFTNDSIFYPSGLWAGGGLSSRSGRAGGCQAWGTHVFVTTWIFSVQSSVELSRPVAVHWYGHLPICPIWACLWTKNLSNLAQIGSRLCGTQISETAGWI